MNFEYDKRKSDSNLLKHGIDFDDIQELWEGWHASAGTKFIAGEKREIVVGKIDGAYWSVVITCRGEVIRIISARRSTTKERSYYDQAYNNRRIR